MGIALGLGAGIFYGLSSICFRVGMKHQAIDNGHFMSVLVNCGMVGTVALFTTLPRWDLTGILFFVLAGTMTSFIGRGTSLMAIRLIGPSRQSAILVTAPVFAALFGWVVLNEQVRWSQAFGALLTTAGLILLIRTRADEETAREGVARGDRFTRGVAIAILSAGFFGTGYVIRKVGLSYYPSSVIGALVGASTAFVLISARAAGSGHLSQLIGANFKPVPWMFVVSGVVSGTALLMQFKAFNYLDAWLVALLQGTQGVWALMWSYLFLRREEKLGKELVASVLLVLAGVGVITKT